MQHETTQLDQGAVQCNSYIKHKDISDGELNTHSASTYTIYPGKFSQFEYIGISISNNDFFFFISWSCIQGFLYSC